MDDRDPTAVVLSDTHRETGHGLVGRAADAVSATDHLVHAGDFTTMSVLESFASMVSHLTAVHGNRDTPAVSDRVPATRTLDLDDVRLAVTHGDDREEMSLALFGRAEDAAVVVSGHTHRPHLIDADDVLLLNPGIHTDPRADEPTHAELLVTNVGVRVRILTRDGTVVGERTLESDG